MTKALVKIENASLFIPGESKRELILHSINWNIMQNRHYALIGANGSGKSTLLRLIHGDLFTCSGSIAWLGPNGYESSRIYAREITELVSPLLQEECQKNAWSVTVQDMLLSGLANSPLSYTLTADHNTDEVIRAIMSRMGGLSWLPLKLPALSQGQLRLALIGRALLRKPQILLLDECADGLDQEHKDLFFNVLKDAAKEMTVIFAAHRKDNIPEWCNERRYLHNGELYTENPVNAHKSRFNRNNFFQKLEIKEQPTVASQPLFQLKNVSVYIDRQLALSNINWEMHVGENWRIRGPNGSGKSTFLRLLAREELAAAGGSITRWDFKAQEWAQTLDATRRNVCLVSDLSQVLYAYDLTGLELVCSGFDNTIGLYRDLSQWERDEAMAFIEYFFDNPDRIARASIRRLSTGQLRKLYLGRALMNKPKVLLLDEPCNGLYIDARLEYIDALDTIISPYQSGYNPNIVIVSHYNEDMPKNITHRARMDEGKLYIEN